MTQPPGRFRRIIVRGLRDVTIGLAVLSAVLWAGSALFGSIGIFTLGHGRSLRFGGGVAEVRHVYQYNVAPPVPHAQWHNHAVKMGWTTKPRPFAMMLPPIVDRFLPGNFHYSSGHVIGISDGRAVSPALHSILQVPLWAMMLPGTIIGVRLLWRWHDERRRQGRGFSIVGAAGGEPRQTLPVASESGTPVHS